MPSKDQNSSFRCLEGEPPKTPTREITLPEIIEAPKKSQHGLQLSGLYAGTDDDINECGNLSLGPSQHQFHQHSFYGENERKNRTNDFQDDALLPDTQGDSTVYEMLETVVEDLALPDTQGGATQSFVIRSYNEASFDDSLLPDTQESESAEVLNDNSISRLNAHVSTTQLASETQSFDSTSKDPLLQPSTPKGPVLERVPRNKLTIKERKRVVVNSSRPTVLTKAMRLWVQKTEYLLDPFREDDDCWLHPSPPGAQVNAHGNLRPVGKLQKAFTWTDRSK